MTITAVWTFTGATPEQYERVFELGGAAIHNQPNRLSHLCYRTDDGICVTDVWADEASFAAFGAIIGPATEAAGLLDARKSSPSRATWPAMAFGTREQATMNRRTFACLAAATAATIAPGAMNRTASASVRPTAYSVTVTDSNLVDNTPAGFGIADVLVFSGSIQDEDGTAVGRFDGQCTVTSNQGQAYCTPVLTLPAGQILLAGSRSIVTLEGHLAVVGGTGRYRDARGDAIAHDNDLTHRQGTFDITLRS